MRLRLLPRRSVALVPVLVLATALVLAACRDDDNPPVSVAGNPVGNPAGDASGAAPASTPDGASTPAGSTPASPPPVGSRATIGVLATTDLESNLLSYDYYKGTADPSFGFERTATLIAQARREFPNTVLFDVGDTIAGNALADYQARGNPLPCNQTLAVYKVMNAAGYAGGTLGDEDFSYGLPYLSQVTGSRLDVDGLPAPAQQPACGGPTFPLVLANVISARTNQPLFPPYAIIDKAVTATAPDGSTVSGTVKIGILGLTTPSLTQWYQDKLGSAVYTTGVVEAEQKYVPEMRAKGADMIIVLSHGGIDTTSYSPTMENGSYWVAVQQNFDALLFGHAHMVFPDPSALSPPGTNIVAGVVSDRWAASADYWGRDLGVIRFDLVWSGSGWTFDQTKTHVESRSIQNADGSYVAADPGVLATISAEHQATLAYMQQPIGTTDFRMSTYFSDLGDPGALQVVNQAMTEYATHYLQQHFPQYASAPVIALNATFQAGDGGANDYIDIAPGNLTLADVGKLYQAPYRIAAVALSSSQLRNWLNNAAQWRLNGYEWLPPGPVPLRVSSLGIDVGPDNFDMAAASGLSYEIDLYPTGDRVTNLAWNGVPLPVFPQPDNGPYIVVTTDYRVQGGGYDYSSIDPRAVVFSTHVPVRDIVSDYIREHGAITRAANGSSRAWRFAYTSELPQNLRSFSAPPNRLADASAAGLTGITQIAPDDGTQRGLALYQLDLSQQ